MTTGVLQLQIIEPVSELVSDGIGQGEPRVLVDIAAPFPLTHARHLGQAQCAAGGIETLAQVLPARTRKLAQSRLVSEVTKKILSSFVLIFGEFVLMQIY